MTDINSRDAALNMSKEDFKKTGYFLIDKFADFDSTSVNPVTSGETPDLIKLRCLW